MKKILFAVLACTLLVGCELTTDTKKYKEGTFEGSVVDNYNNQENTATAKVTIDKDGKITSVYVDTTYTTNAGVATTKKTLGADYGMKKGNGAGYGSAEYEWYEQAEALEKKVVEKQGLEGITLDSDGYTDTISGCTMKINALYKAIENALNEAKK